MRKFLLLCSALGLTASAMAQDLADYKTFDFVPGDKLIFADNFAADVVGKAPANWTMLGGSAVIMQEGDEKFVSIKEYYTGMTAKTKLAPLPPAFTLEFDTWLAAGYDGNPGVQIAFNNGTDNDIVITPNRDQTTIKSPDDDISGVMPDNVYGEQYYDRWQHIAIAYDNGAIEVYVNENHVINSKTNFKPKTFKITGNTSDDMPIYFKNFKLAEGGNAIAKSLAAGKFITHGINFDVNKSDIRPESMGVLTEVAKYLKANPAVKFEVDGHTDSDGDEASNLKLSQDRAQAVKAQLVKMGVADAQLTTAGFGESKPIDVNTTAPGKANNRRVEFVKL